MSKRTIKTEVDVGLVQQMQAGVAGADLKAFKGQTILKGPETPPSQTDTPPSPDQGQAHNRHPRSQPGLRKDTSRTTLSVPSSVGEKARRLTLALTLYEGLEASLGATVSRALDLLQLELEEAGVSVPERAVKLRSGPRHI